MTRLRRYHVWAIDLPSPLWFVASVVPLVVIVGAFIALFMAITEAM